MPRKRPPLMSHADRRKLIEAPISINVIGSHQWAGSSVVEHNDDGVPMYRAFRRHGPGLEDNFTPANPMEDTYADW